MNMFESDPTNNVEVGDILIDFLGNPCLVLKIEDSKIYPYHVIYANRTVNKISKEMIRYKTDSTFNVAAMVSIIEDGLDYLPHPSRNA